MTKKLSRRKFLFSALSALFGSWAERYWKREPQEENRQYLSVGFDRSREPGGYTTTLAIFKAPDGVIQYWGKIPDDFMAGYLNWLDQQRALRVFGPRTARIKDISWQIEGDAIRAKRIEAILRRADA